MAETIGYARVSTGDQVIDGQTDALKAAGCGKIFADEGVSGSKASRPEWDRARDHLRAGDTLVVCKLDRMGRSLAAVLDVIDDLAEKDVALRILDIAVDTTTPAGRLMVSVLGAVAELERSLIRERTIAGLEAARRRGRIGGRRPALSPQRRQHAVELVADGMSVTEAAETMGVGRSTLYRALQAVG